MIHAIVAPFLIIINFSSHNFFINIYEKIPQIKNITIKPELTMN